MINNIAWNSKSVHFRKRKNHLWKSFKVKPKVIDLRVQMPSKLSFIEIYFHNARLQFTTPIEMTCKLIENLMTHFLHQGERFLQLLWINFCNWNLNLTRRIEQKYWIFVRMWLYLIVNVYMHRNKNKRNPWQINLYTFAILGVCIHTFLLGGSCHNDNAFIWQTF